MGKQHSLSTLPHTVVRITEEDPTLADGTTLIAELDALLLSLFPLEQCTLLPPTTVKDFKFFIARRKDDSRALGCVAVKDHGNGEAELKRMFVRPRARGMGVGKALLEAAEEYARKMNIDRMLIETGHKLVEANSLYVKYGYTEIPLFGEYASNPDKQESILLREAAKENMSTKDPEKDRQVGRIRRKAGCSSI